MFTSSIFRRPADRRPRARRPLVEGLEGRRVPSALGVGAGADIINRHPSTIVEPEIVGQHIGTNAVAAIQGNHIGTNVA